MYIRKEELRAIFSVLEGVGELVFISFCCVYMSGKFTGVGEVEIKTLLLYVSIRGSWLFTPIHLNLQRPPIGTAEVRSASG